MSKIYSVRNKKVHGKKDFLTVFIGKGRGFRLFEFGLPQEAGVSP
jgi:hypothetical protein